MSDVQVFKPGSSHQIPLVCCVQACTEPVLELGCGWYSTPLLHALCQGRRLISVDSDRDWMDQFSCLTSKSHSLICSTPEGDCVLPPAFWGVVLVDNRPHTRRVVDIQKFRRTARWLVCHDTEDPVYGYGPVLDTFTYRCDFTLFSPWTSVVSDNSPIPESLLSCSSGAPHGVVK